MISLQTSIEIEAPAESVWHVLTDFGSYADWNPFLRAVRGEARAGARIQVQVELPGQSRGMTVRAVVTAAEAPRELRWQGGLPIPGLFTGKHYIVLDALAPTRTRLVHGEDFHGLLARLLPGSAQAKALAGYDAMNHALKQRVEALAPAS